MNGKSKIVDQISHYSEANLPVTVCGELLYGALNSNQIHQNLVRFLHFFSSCTIFKIDISVAEAYANIRKALKKKGRPIPENDIWIAASCLANEIPLATGDKHFTFIEGLKLIEL